MIWSIASSIDSTTATARILSRYSVSQSAGSAGFMRGHDLARDRVSAQLDAFAHQGLGRLGEKDRRDRVMDQQRLGRIADAGR